MRTYNNPWIPAGAKQLLAEHRGSLLDVGGGRSPYARATHILDIQPYSEERLRENAWPAGKEAKGWAESDYTRMDIVSERQWPFDTHQFDLGLCSHCLEDLRDPIPAVRELARVCRRILVICPSRLIEQTRGIEHPRFCGFSHHPWAVFADGERLVFRRKTPVLMLPRAHVVCPIGKTLRVEDGSMYFHGETVAPEEQVFFAERDDLEDYARFIAPYRERADLFIRDQRRNTVRFWLWKLRQSLRGTL